MDDKTLVFGHTNPDTDSIASAISMADLQLQLGNEAQSYRLGKLNKETTFALSTFQVEQPDLLANIEENTNVIMVDSNEFSQSVNGIESANIKMVVDHHRLNLQTTEPVFCIAEPVGCTSTILYKLYRQNDMPIPPAMAGLMLSAIVSDTLLFKSPTCTQQDRLVAEKLARIAGIDLYDYGFKLLEAGTNISDFTGDEIINIDAKEFRNHDLKLVISQINSANIENVFLRKMELEAAIEKKIEEDSIDLYVFVVTDIIKANSKAIVLGNRKDIFEKGYNIKLIGNMAYLSGVVSRKKEILPKILEGINKKIQLK